MNFSAVRPLMSIASAAGSCALWLGVAGAPLHAQSCSPGTTFVSLYSGDKYLDEAAPFGYDPPLSLIDPDPLPPPDGEGTDFGLLSALEVGVADFNGDGIKDVVLGGNSTKAQGGVVVYYLNGGHTWSVDHAEILPYDPDNTGKGTMSCYDLDVGFINDDNLPDIVVGRRLTCEQVRDGEVDTVFFNDPQATGLAPRFPLDHSQPLPNPTFALLNCCDAPVDPPGPCVNLPPYCAGSTLGVELGDVDLDANNDLEILTGGDDYPTRYFTNGGLASFPTFTYQTDYLDGFNINYRMCVLGDIDDDGDLDLVVARLNQSDNPEDPNRVYFNQKIELQGSFDPNNPFLISQQPPLQWVAVDHVEWEASPACNGELSGTVPGNGMTMEVALSDLDQDDDLDLVATSYMGRNAAYLNNSNGYFGCFDDPGEPGWPMNNGQPAFIFPGVTPSWTGSDSVCLVGLCNAAYKNWHQPQPLAVNCNIEFTVPGTILNNCTGISIADVNHDHLPDISFSYRNDLEEICRRGPIDLPYLSDSGPPVPPTFDVLFLNESVEGQLAFSDCIEQIGIANDGTGYGDLVKINSDDRAFDWVDANTNNMMQIDVQRIIWGNTLTSGVVGCDTPLGLSGAGGGAAAAELVIAGAEEMAGLPFIVFASATGTAGGFGFLDAVVPLAYDDLTAWLAVEGAATSTDEGVLDKEGIGRISIELPPEAGIVGESVWFAAIVWASDGKAVLVTNPLEVKVSSP